MEVVGDPGLVPEVQGEVLAVCEAIEGRLLVMSSVERAEFYNQARSAFAVVATGEARPFGCILLTKGVVSTRPEVGQPATAKSQPMADRP
jgi:L-fucose mutarotase